MSNFDYSISPYKYQDRQRQRQRLRDSRQRQRQRDRDRDRQNYLHPNRYTQTKLNNPSNANVLNTSNNLNNKTGYKYTYYRQPEQQYEYHSRESLPMDSLRVHQRKDDIGMGIGIGIGSISSPSLSVPPVSLAQRMTQLISPSSQGLGRSPSFRRPQPQINQSLNYIDNIIQSHRSRYSKQSSSLEHNNFEVQSEQILFLKEKLIQTHNKLLKELEQTNRLTLQLQTAQAQAQAEQKQNTQLHEENAQLRQQIDRLHAQLDQYADKNIEKYRSLESKFTEEARRNSQLKDDLQAMRNKMLETLLIKNNYEETNADYRNQLSNTELTITKYRNDIKEKDQAIQNLTSELELMRKKYTLCEQECEHRAEEIHQYNHLALERENALNTLQQDLKNQKEKSVHLLNEYTVMQAEHKGAIKKIEELEDACRKYKDEIYWAESNKENGLKMANEQIDRLKEEINIINIKYKEKEKEIEIMRRKPVVEAQKKRKNYENTREFVNRLETEQIQLGQSRNTARAQSKGSARGGMNNTSANPKSPHANHSLTVRNPSKSPANRSYSPENPITHQPITHAQPNPYQQQKSKYITILSQVGDLQKSLLNCNQQKKKMLKQMDKIDDTKVKTREMINRRRELEDDIIQQEQKIKKVKEQLRRVKAL